MQPEIRYARLGKDRIAYQVVGTGPIDLVLTPGSFGSADGEWEDPMARLFFQRLASFSRLIRFDRRGTGGSDPVPLNGLPPWESYVEELLCVMDEVGSERAAIMVAYDAGPMGMLFAATKPERTTSLVLLNTTAKYVVSNDYPIGLPWEIAEQMVDQIGDVWGTEAQVYLSVPSRAEDPRFRQWYAKLLRAIASPAAAQAYYRAVFDADARPLLPSIHVPTLVIQRTDTPFIPMAQGRYLADHIEGAKFLEIPGSDVPVIWEHPDLVLEAVEEFLTGVRRGEEPDRMLATVLFTDIVDSTRRARELGDRRWRGLLDAHDEVTRRLIEEYGGRLIKSTGDGILATFDGPGRGVRCATALRDELRALGLEIRAGLHTGEIELRGADVGGMAVHIGARVMAAAGTGEILVSRTVRDLTVGSDIAFSDQGTHDLKGVEGDWQLFAVG